MTTLWVAAIALIGLEPLGGCGLASQAAEKVYKTPQAVFDAAIAAAKKQDFKAFCECMDDESRDALAGQFAMMGMMVKSFSEFDPKDKGKAAPLDAILKKHGLTEEVMKKGPPNLPRPAKAPKGPDEQNKAMAEMARVMIKDRTGFIVEMLAALEKMGDKPKKSSPIFAGEVSLVDLKIDGNSAKGTLLTRENGKEDREPISFKKQGPTWKVVMPAKFSPATDNGLPGSPPTQPAKKPNGKN
jgi:hypothetical protein